MLLTLTDSYGRPLWQDGKIIPPQILVRTRDKFANAFMRGRFGLKKFQRGILQVAASNVFATGGAVTISVSNIIIAHTVTSGLVNAGIEFNETSVGSVSTLVKRHNADRFLMGDDDAGSPVDHTGEWTTDGPAAAAFEVSCTSEDTGTWDFLDNATGIGSYDTFATADIGYRENRTGGKGFTPGTDQCIGTFRIREVADPGGNFDDFTVDASAIQQNP